MTDEEAIITRLASMSLRHGANIKFLVEQLNKSNGNITSFGKAVARILKKYIPEGESSTLKCEDCGSTNVVFEEGCSKCKDCGSSKCG
jgi:ribonucleoside-diphosphate reductase alpha chain